MSEGSSNEARLTDFVPLMTRANGTSDCLPTGLVTGPAEALAQLCADLEAARGEIEVEREAGRIQRNKAISNYAEVRQLRGELRRATALQEATLKQLVGALYNLKQSRATEAELRAKIKQLTDYHEWCGDCGEARADIPRCTLCTIAYPPVLDDAQESRT